MLVTIYIYREREQSWYILVPCSTLGALLRHSASPCMLARAQGLNTQIYPSKQACVKIAFALAQACARLFILQSNFRRSPSKSGHNKISKETTFLQGRVRKRKSVRPVRLGL